MNRLPLASTRSNLGSQHGQLESPREVAPLGHVVSLSSVDCGCQGGLSRTTPASQVPGLRTKGLGIRDHELPRLGGLPLGLGPGQSWKEAQRY